MWAQQRLFHSCRNRHCPQCQSGARDAWRQAQLAELLPVPYCHLVFTLPHALNGLAQRHARWVYRTLMQCAAATLTEFAANPRWLGATGAFTLVLHTWTQDLRRHVHVHALMACGGLDADARWCTPKRSPTFLFPVHALSRVFRGKFLDALRRASQAGELPLDPADTELARQTRLKELTRHDWVVYAKTPLAGPEVVLDYLSRYTHRVAISNERIVGIDAKGVRLRVRADAHGGKRTTVIDGQTFIARFLQHVLPPGFKRIRHYGLLSAALKTERLAAGARGAGHAGGQRSGSRGRGRLHQARGRHRGLVLPALSTGALAHHRSAAGHERISRRDDAVHVPGAAVNRRQHLNVARSLCRLDTAADRLVPANSTPPTTHANSIANTARPEHSRPRTTARRQQHRRTDARCASLDPAAETYIPQQPRTPSPCGGSVQRGLSDAISIGASGQLRWGVG